MTSRKHDAVQAPGRGLTTDNWQQLRELTDARIALGRAGTSLPTSAHLQFQQDHALARDAVHTPFDTKRIAADLSTAELASVLVDSCAAERTTYLQRPDLGRKLTDDSRALLPVTPCDLVLIIGDGLSALAAHCHAVPVAQRLHAGLNNRGLSVAPIVVANGARVGLSDDIGATMNARAAIILLGERPGLSSADSLGAYLTWCPGAGRTDADRNCVSNIRPNGGLSYEAATHKLLYLALESARRELSGVELKDGSDQVDLLT